MLGGDLLSLGTERHDKEAWVVDRFRGAHDAGISIGTGPQAWRGTTLVPVWGGLPATGSRAGTRRPAMQWSHIPSREVLFES